MVESLGLRDLEKSEGRENYPLNLEDKTLCSQDK